MPVAKDKEERFDFRVDSEAKRTIEKAAQILGVTVTAYATQTLVESAQSVIERYERTILSDRDRDRFLEIMDADKPAPFKLKRALERYREHNEGQGA